MLHDAEMTPAQVNALATWVVDGTVMAPVRIRVDSAKLLYVAQGDDGAVIDQHGTITNE